VKTPKSAMFKRRRRVALAFATPGIIALIVFMFVPIIYAFTISLRKYNMAMPANKRVYCGFENYADVVTNRHFTASIEWTLLFALLAVIGTVCLAMLIALALNSPFVKGLLGRLIKTVFLVPMMACPLVIGYVWKIVYAPNYGLLNAAFNWLGLPTVYWTATTEMAKVSIMITELWWGTPYVMIILLAALSTVSPDLYEAADIEGANRWQKFWNITVPSIMNFIVLVLSLRIMDALKMFDLAYSLTEGGPSRSTETMAYFVYTTSFSQNKLGLGSAAAFILFAIVAVFTMIFKALTRRLSKLDV